MAKLRRARSYRRLERPYTRKSKYRAKSFVRATPSSKVVRYTMGNQKRRFRYKYKLISKNNIQIRHNAIESARECSNRVLERNLGKAGFNLKILPYTHHILRENPLAAGAGADRMSTGMKMSFGKPIGVAARVKKGQIIVVLKVDKSGVEIAKTALKRFNSKLPGSTTVQMERVEAK